MGMLIQRERFSFCVCFSALLYVFTCLLCRPCQPCGLAADEKAQLTALVIAALVYFALLSFACAFLSDKWLVRVVAGVLIVQQLSAVGMRPCVCFVFSSLNLCRSLALSVSHHRRV